MTTAARYARDAVPADTQAAHAAAPVDAPSATRYAQVILDIPTHALDDAFDYLIPAPLIAQAQVGCCVLVDFNRRPALGYLVGLSDQPVGTIALDKVKPLRELLSPSYFDATAATLARWIADEYLAPLSETIRLFTPPGSTPRLRRGEDGTWQLDRPGIGPVDDRWVALTEDGAAYTPPANAAKQRAIIEALRIGEMRVVELALEIANPSASLKALEKRGLVRVFERRRLRGVRAALPSTSDIQTLTEGQEAALARINSSEPASVILLDGVTGSGKTEVYLQAIRRVLEQGAGAIVLVPEISLTPQTVARFRARFGEQVAVLHSRLAPGERFDQWDLIRSGAASVVVGARSALFAPLPNLGLIVIDEEHEATYKQGSSPRYVTREVARKLAALRGARLVLGSATPTLEVLEDTGILRLELPKRASGKPLPPIQVVDLAAEFKSGNREMFSRALTDALIQVVNRREKAVLLLNRRGFASFLLCRDCGYVPTCEPCATSFTYHERPARLMCHHCGASAEVPVVCPECGSRYIKQLGPGTQYAADKLAALLPEGTPIVRMDADTTRGKSGHEQRLDEFIAAPYGVLLGTQMIAKGLDFPEVTLVGVLIADTALKFPDFRAPERTWQLLEQVAGRAGRQELDGRVIVQTYWPEHLAIRAAARHDRELLLAEERAARRELGYPPYARLANVLIWGADLKAVSAEALRLAAAVDAAAAGVGVAGAGGAGAGAAGAATAVAFMGERGEVTAKGIVGETGVASLDVPVQVLGPSPCVLAKRRGDHRWHILVKAPAGYDLPALLRPILKARKPTGEVNVAVDIDPYDLM